MLSTKNLDLLPQNDQILAPNWHFGHFGPGLAGSFGALLVGWLVVVAQAVSRKTPIYFIDIISLELKHFLVLSWDMCDIVCT